MKKKIVCAMLAAMMVVSTATTPVLAAGVDGTDEQSGEFTTEGVMKNPTYKVSVSTDLNLYIDPFQLMNRNGSNSTDVTSTDFSVINKSNAPIEVNATIKMDTAEGVTLVESGDKVTKDSTKKVAAVTLEIPSAVTETTATTTAAYVSAKDWTTAYTTLYKDTSKATPSYYKTSDTTNVVSQGSVAAEMLDTLSVKGTYTTKKSVNVDVAGDTVLTFALAEADYTDIYDKYNDKDNNVDPLDSTFKNVAASQKGSAVFRFGGKVNPKADWEDSDISATIAYSFKALTDEDWGAAEAKITANSEAHSFVESKVNAGAKFAAGSKVGQITFTDGGGDYAIDTITSIEMTNEGGTFDGYHAYEGAWDAATTTGTTIQLNSAFITFFNKNSTTKATITYTTVGGDTKTATVDVKTK